MNALLTPQLAERCLALAGSHSPPLAGVGVGMPGLHSGQAASALERVLAARLRCPVAVAGDAEVAHLGAFLGGPGVAIVAGTGSVAIGRDGSRTARAGGHGFVLGDEGGAYWLGREGVRAALRTRDGLGGSERLAQALEAASGGTLDRLVAAVHRAPSDRTLLSRLAPVVTSLANADREADRIVTEAARHLAALGTAVAQQLRAVPSAAVGGVFASAELWDRFAGLMEVGRPAAPPEAGALLLAARPDLCRFDRDLAGTWGEST